MTSCTRAISARIAGLRHGSPAYDCSPKRPYRLLQEQIAYYRARAGEYDEWFLRTGRYDRGPEGNRQWFAEIAEVAEALAAFAPAGRVLELACGTGWWTAQLARNADSVTAREQQVDDVAAYAEPPVAKSAEHVFACVRDLQHAVEAEHPRAALDGVRVAEQTRDELPRRGMLLELQQPSG